MSESKEIVLLPSELRDGVRRYLRRNCPTLWEKGKTALVEVGQHTVQVTVQLHMCRSLTAQGGH